jgi:acyl-CoA thioesterase
MTEDSPELSAAEARIPLSGADKSEGVGVAAARAMWAADSASAGLGMELVSLETGHAVVRMPVTEAMVNGHAIAHGGFVFALADSAFALACNSHGPVTVAAGCDITFVAPVRRGDVLVADAVERARFGRSGLTDVSVRVEGSGELVAELRGRSRTIGSTASAAPVV